MTWGEFKKAVEKKGVKDIDFISFIDTTGIYDGELITVNRVTTFTNNEVEIGIEVL